MSIETQDLDNSEELPEEHQAEVSGGFYASYKYSSTTLVASEPVKLYSYANWTSWGVTNPNM